MSQKGFSAIILLLPVLIAVVLIVFFVRLVISNKNTIPNQSQLIAAATGSKSISTGENGETAVVYSNDPLGFEFTYTKGFTVLEDSEDKFNKRGLTNFRKNFTSYIQYMPPVFLSAVVVLDTSNSYEKNPFTVWIFENPDNIDIDSWYKKYWYYPFVWGDFTYEGKTKLSPQKEGTISGTPVKSGTIDYQAGKPKFTYLSKDGKMYLFRTIGSNGEAILNTFEFLQ